MLLLASAHRESFEAKRKKHYNEFQAVKLARKLIAEDEDDDFMRVGTESTESFVSPSTSSRKKTQEKSTSSPESTSKKK